MCILRTVHITFDINCCRHSFRSRGMMWQQLPDLLTASTSGTGNKRTMICLYSNSIALNFFKLECMDHPYIIPTKTDLISCRYRVRPGAIIVVHDRWHTAATLRKALPAILKSGSLTGKLDLFGPQLTCCGHRFVAF